MCCLLPEGVSLEIGLNFVTPKKKLLILLSELTIGTKIKVNITST